jgi:RNA polymerase sigma-70 factor (family 1)
MGSDTLHITQTLFKELFDKYFESLCRYLAYYSANSMIVEEVVQDVFIKLWEERESLRIESIKSYLFTAAHNRMLNHLRNEKRYHTLIELWTIHEKQKGLSGECFDIEEFSDRVQHAIDQLPGKCREIFDLSKREGLTYRQISEKLDISVKTVETQMGIALRKIREHLSAFYPRNSSILIFIRSLVR